MLGMFVPPLLKICTYTFSQLDLLMHACKPSTQEAEQEDCWF
jgi:hypothetical protein